MRRPSSHQALFALCSILLVAPLWLVRYPPMIDLPQHAAQIYLLRHLDDPGAGYREVFQVNWLTPYYFGYSIAWLLSHAMSITNALRLEITVAQLGIPLALAALLRESGGRASWALLGFPIAYSSSYYFGFLNFMTATPLLIWAMVPLLRYARTPTRRRALALAALSLFFFWCHVVLAFIYGLAGCLLVAPRAPRFRDAVVRCLPFAAAAPLAVLWFVATRATEPLTARTVTWDLAARAPDLFTNLAGGFRFDPGWTLAGLVLFAIPFITGARPSREPSRWLPFAGALLFYLLVPHSVFGTAFLYMRFAIFTFVFYLLALEPVPPHARSAPRPLGRYAIPLFVVALLASQAVRVYNFDRESAPFERIVSSMEPGRRVLSLTFVRTSRYSQFSVYQHFASWYQAEKGGFVDFSFASFYPVMVRFLPGREPPITEDFNWAPHTFDWDTHCGACYDYILVRSPQNLERLVFAEADRPYRLLTRAAWWWLYEVGPPSARATSSGHAG